jgi:hypothetical protein
MDNSKKIPDWVLVQRKKGTLVEDQGENTICRNTKKIKKNYTKIGICTT